MTKESLILLYDFSGVSSTIVPDLTGGGSAGSFAEQTVAARILEENLFSAAAARCSRFPEEAVAVICNFRTEF